MLIESLNAALGGIIVLLLIVLGSGLIVGPEKRKNR